MLTLHVRHSATHRETHSATRAPSTAQRATSQRAISQRATAQHLFVQTQSSAVINAAIRLLSSYPMLSEADIARGYPLVININPRRAMH